MVIRKSTLEWVLLITLFIFSFLNQWSLLLFLLSLIVLLLQKEIGAIKILNLLTFRTIINDGVAVSIGSAQNIKWLMLFGCSLYLIIAYFKLNESTRKKINPVLVIVLLFTAFNIVTDLLYSSLPLVATMKMLSYSVIFIGVLIGVAYTSDKFNWLKWLIGWFYVIFVMSVISFASPISYLKNGVSFQGITNQPNMFGIVSVLFVALLLAYNLQYKNSSAWHIYLTVPTVLLMVIMSKSRTALLGCLVLFLVYLLFKNKKITHLRIAIISFIGATLTLFIPKTFNSLVTFMHKGQTPEDFLYSRENQLNNLIYNFKSSPLFGTGFSIPNLLPYRSFEFGMDYIVEPGNLFLAVLSYSGIIGFGLFSLYMFMILYSNKMNFRSNLPLFLAPVIISMGEMVFFSSNNIGIWCYMLLAMYMFTDVKGKQLEHTVS